MANGDVDKLLGDLTGRFNFTDVQKDLLGKVAGGLLEKLENGTDKDLPNIVSAIGRLVADDKLQLTEGEDLDKLVDAAGSALDLALSAIGERKLITATRIARGAFKFLNTKFDRCGGKVPSPGETSPAPPVERKNGRHIIVYYLEEDNGAPILPPVAGNPRWARSRLRDAFESWEGVLELDVTRTEDPTGANLIVTGRDFGPEVPDSVLALTDIGPPAGQQLRMVFDLAEKPVLKKDEFEATAAHEFGHALGIRHSDVFESNQLMSPMLDKNVSEPRAGDLRAAKAKEWVLSDEGKRILSGS